MNKTDLQRQDQRNVRALVQGCRGISASLESSSLEALKCGCERRETREGDDAREGRKKRMIVAEEYDCSRRKDSRACSEFVGYLNLACMSAFYTAIVYELSSENGRYV